ncbi:hypothetical protein [Confluentibacter citreus]|uniref:hypothetical protein n=1 Tax=Confluentibacter citreus TaxID=2007307 RepID=UPI000C2815AB|nr:hypothetical protein [Confluentibacter citreus]
MTDKETIKFIDILINDYITEIDEEFTISNFLDDNEEFQKIRINKSHQNDLEDSMWSFGINNEIFSRTYGRNIVLGINGRELKRFGKGYLEYVKHESANNLTNIGVTIENYIGGDNHGVQSSNFSNSPQTNNITANNNADLKTKPIIKFWKLISENKLISSIIFVVILYLINLFFGIDLN